MTDIWDATDFAVQDGAITHNVTIGSGRLSSAAEGADDEDYVHPSLLARADTGVYGGSVFEEDRTKALRNHFESHREYATMMDAMASSSFRDHLVCAPICSPRIVTPACSVSLA